MKLASLKNGRDGRLLVVSQDLRRAVLADEVALTLQDALDDWDHIEPSLLDLATRLEMGAAKDHPFEPAACASPLPRAYQWADGSAYLNHVALMRRAQGAEMPPSFWTDPLLYQGGSHSFLAPTDPIRLDDPAWGGDFAAEVAVITGEVRQGATMAQARGAIRLVMLVNDISLRGLAPTELAKGSGFFQSKPASAFSPVAATPDSFGDAWDGGRLHLPLLTHLNGALFGKPNAGTDMTFDFPTLIAHAARTRPLTAGSIIGSGTVSNHDADGGPGKPVAQGGLGYSCLAEIRIVETLQTGQPSTPFLAPGDHIHIEMKDGEGQSLFGAISQSVVGPG